MNKDDRKYQQKTRDQRDSNGNVIHEEKHHHHQVGEDKSKAQR